MAVRILFLLLLALNLGAGAWLLFGHAPAAPLPPPTDPGIPALQLLAQTPPRAHRAATSAATGATASAAAATAAVAASAAPRPVADVCMTLGPFTLTADMRRSLQTLSPHVARIQYREEQVSRSHGFWVYLPPTTTREAALDEARKLAAKGITDYYVVTAGDAQNTVSLGLFDDPDNAQRRVQQLQKLGFGAKVKQRVDTEPAYWIDYAVPPGETFDWKTWLPGRSDLKAKPIDCF